MSDHPATASQAHAPDTELCMLLACFGDVKQAARIRRSLDRRIVEAGDTVLDEVVLRVDARHGTRVYDPRRVLAGALTAAVTWGVFGLLTGGVASGGLWAIVGAVCGGLYAYFAEHLFTKDELKRLGQRLPAGSSAITAFVRTDDARRVLASAAPAKPAQASVAAISADLSARVVTGATMPVETSAAPPGGGTAPGRPDSLLSMLLVRYRGSETARGELARNRPENPKDRQPVQAELLFRAPEHGRAKVSDPTKQGAARFATSDLISWGLFGVIYGLIVGLVSNHGIFTTVKDTAAAGVICAVFGLAAGALVWPVGRTGSIRSQAQERPPAAASRHLDGPGLVGGRPDTGDRRRLVRTGLAAAHRAVQPGR